MTSQDQKNQFKQNKDMKYESYFKNSPIGIAILYEDGCIEETNSAFIDHIDGENCEVLGQHYSKVFDDEVVQKFFTMFEILNKSNQPYTKDVISLRDCGENQKIFEVTLSEFFDGEEQSKKSMLFTEDITHQKDTHMALLQSEKLALTGRLAASLAHEINNPLQTSLGCLGLVEEMLDENDDRELSVYINLAIEELQRSARIVKKLRDLNRSTDLTERTRVNLQEIIEGVLVLTKNHLDDKKIVPMFPYQGPPPDILASKDQIQQVVLNLVMNAIDEMPNGGKIVMDINRSDQPKGISIIIRDTGNGIDPEIAKKIFDPFFTTKEEGIGLGLFISKQIIENHSGTLDFSSSPGKGTQFRIWLPEIEVFEEEER
jgi:PAS domain S-box-containing protein